MFFRNLETQKNIIMDNIEECDYGFFCDLETEQIIVYPKQKIGFNNYLPSIKENYILDICDSNKSLYAENMKAAFLDNFNFKSILLYVLVSFSSIYITTRLFYKNHN